jgi:hypothetical protein
VGFNEQEAKCKNQSSKEIFVIIDHKDKFMKFERTQKFVYCATGCLDAVIFFV